MIFVGHFPIFSCGWQLTAGADWMWFGSWIGILNFLCGVVGSLARLPDFSFSQHKYLRRSYFILNCSFIPFCNGIGLASNGITLAAVQLICNKNSAQMFTAVMAFICFLILAICMISNAFAVVYQVCSTCKCKCYICNPRNRTVTSVSSHN